MIAQLKRDGLLPRQPDYPREAYFNRLWSVTIPPFRTPAAASSLTIALSGQFPRTMQIDPALPEGGVAAGLGTGAG